METTFSDHQAEQAICRWLIHEPEPAFPLINGLAPADFHHPDTRAVFSEVLWQIESGHYPTVLELQQILVVDGDLDPVLFLAATQKPDGASVLADPKRVAKQAQRVKDLAIRRELHRQVPAILEAGGTGAEMVAKLETTIETLSTGGGAAPALMEKVEARRFDHATQPDPPKPVYQLAGKTICTGGNITNIQAGPKAGKTAAGGGMIGSTVKGRFVGGDNLGFFAENPDGKALIHLDTEQSRFDADRVIRRALTRAEVHHDPPAWLWSYSLADMDIADRRRALPLLMEKAAETCGGVHSVIIDGVGDLLTTLNDEVIAFGLVGELHSLAIRYDCPIITVLHENPGSEKTRGHLGSQLERKAETNLRLSIDSEGITTIYTEKARHGPIPKEFGVCFEWSDEAGMHVSAGDAKQRKMEAKIAAMREEADRVLGNEPDGLSYVSLLTLIREELDVSEGTAKNRRRDWLGGGVIRKNHKGFYLLND